MGQIGKVTIGGSTKIQTGSAIDTVTIDDSTFGGFQLFTGLGADVVNVEQKTGTTATTHFLAKLKVDLGSGADTMVLGTPADSTREVELFGPPN